MKTVDWKEFWDIFKDKIVSDEETLRREYEKLDDDDRAYILEDLNEMPKGPIIFFRFPEETK
jgi:hypothetical protein